jgi:hypothetical protein
LFQYILKKEKVVSSYPFTLYKEDAMFKHTYLIVSFKEGTSVEEADAFFINKGMSGSEYHERSATGQPQNNRVARKTRVPFEQWKARAIECMEADCVKYVGVGYHTN